MSQASYFTPIAYNLIFNNRRYGEATSVKFVNEQLWTEQDGYFTLVVYNNSIFYSQTIDQSDINQLLLLNFVN